MKDFKSILNESSDTKGKWKITAEDLSTKKRVNLGDYSDETIANNLKDYLENTNKKLEKENKASYTKFKVEKA